MSLDIHLASLSLLRGEVKIFFSADAHSSTEVWKEWLDLLANRVDTRKVIAVTMPGNDDNPDIDGLIKSYQDRGVVYPSYLAVWK